MRKVTLACHDNGVPRLTRSFSNTDTQTRTRRPHRHTPLSVPALTMSRTVARTAAASGTSVSSLLGLDSDISLCKKIVRGWGSTRSTTTTAHRAAAVKQCGVGHCRGTVVVVVVVVVDVALGRVVRAGDAGACGVSQAASQAASFTHMQHTHTSLDTVLKRVAARRTTASAHSKRLMALSGLSSFILAWASLSVWSSLVCRTQPTRRKCRYQRLAM
jgi:hypothetical protein